MGLTSDVRVLAVLATALAGGVADLRPAQALDQAFPQAPAMLRVAQTAPPATPDIETLPKSPAAAPTLKPKVAQPPKPATPPKPVASTVPAKPGTPAAKPPVKVAKSTVAKVPPAAKKAVSVAALTGQDVLPEHRHQSIDVPQTECPGNPNAIGISRIIKVDTTGGFYVGQTYHTKMPLLNPREVILTFDDGPYPTRTDRVLAALKHECTHGTFFLVGQMAKAFPAEARKIALDGNTIAYHTMTHSYKLAKGPLDQSQTEISNGWKVVDQAVYGKSGDKPMTHFFRYPGLFNNRGINQWFNTLDMGVFAVDAVGNDWLKGHLTAAEWPAVMNEALSELERNNGGILLLHDIKESSSNAVAPLLVELKKRGFKIVHIVPMIDPPPIASGPMPVGTIDTTPAPLPDRNITGFDPAHQVAQEKLGKVGAPSTSPAPLPAYQQPATALKPVKTGKPAAEGVDTTTTQSIRSPGPVAPALPPQAQPDDGWFSSTARSFKGIGTAVGLW